MELKGTSQKKASPKETWNGELYHKISSQQLEGALRILGRFQFNGNERVLDIGCGSGKVTHDMATHFFADGTVIGIDACQSMLDTAKKEYPTLEFCLRDATKLNYNQEFDLVVSFNCFHWIKDIETLFTGIKQSLKSEGKIIALFSIDDLNRPCRSGMSIIRKLMNTEKWGCYFPSREPDWNTFSVEDYYQALECAGLTGEIKIEDAPDWVFENKDKFLEYCSSIPLKSEIPNNLKFEFLSDFIDLYKEINYPNRTEESYLFHRRDVILVAR